jgi:hypothetical protein
MRERFLGSTITVAIAAAATVILVPIPAPAQAPAGSATAPPPTVITPWGEPDLQGIWTDEFDTPLQRPAKYANQEFFGAAGRIRQRAIGNRPWRTPVPDGRRVRRSHSVLEATATTYAEPKGTRWPTSRGVGLPD